MKFKKDIFENELFLFLFILVFLIISFISFSGILGLTGKIISDGKNLTESINFESGATKTLTVSIFNTEKQDMDLVVYSEGELADCILLEQSKFSISKDELSKNINYKLVLPENLTPGIHTLDLIVLKMFNGKTIPFITNLYVVVPYPDKYATADLKINSEDNKDVSFDFTLFNRGTISLSEVEANVKIYTKLGEKVAEFETDPVSLEAGNRENVFYQWASDVPSGDYNAVVNLIYDGESYSFEKEFKIGSNILELQQISVREFNLGSLVKLELLVENKKETQFENVHAEINISQDNKFIAEIKSADYNIAGLEKSVLVAFWNTNNVVPGIYDVSVIISNDEKITEENFKAEVSEDSFTVKGLNYSMKEQKSFIDKNRLTAILVIIVLVLILINVGWFLFRRRKK